MKGIFRKTDFICRAAIMLLLFVTTTAWADDNQFVISYMPDPQFGSSESYGDLKKPRCEPVKLAWAPSKKGYTFQHWLGYWMKQDGTMASRNFQAEETLGTDITCNISTSYPFMVQQATFTANNYTLRFHANGGTGSEMADIPMKYNQDITLPACTFSKAGCYLMGWTTKENGSGDFYYDGEKARNFTAEDGVVLDLYAQYNPGNGSADSPWLIDTQATWGILAERVRKGVDSYKYYKMTADVTAPISRMIGTSSHPFNGHFDGDGHNLTINFDAREEDIYAPFKYVNQASFRNLTVSGSIVLDEGYLSAGGFIGDVTHKGTVTLVACRSKVFGLCHWSGSFGGFIGRTAGSGNVIFIDCLSDATVSSYPYPTQVAYFVGVAESGSNISFRNCLETAQKHEFYGLKEDPLQILPIPEYPFVCHTTAGINDTYENCWRRMTDADCEHHNDGPQGTYTSTTQGEAFRATLGAGWTLDGGNYVVPRMPATTHNITVSSDIVHGTVKCLASTAPGETVMLEVTPEEGYHITSVTYNDGSDHNATLRDGKYWFTMPEGDVTVSATFAVDNNAVQYVVYNTESCVYETNYFKRSSVANVTANIDTLGVSGQEKKYVVTGDVTASNRIYIKGTVHLVLADGATLTAQKGINVCRGNSLIVYGQEGGTGTLNANGMQYQGGYYWESAAIGANGFGNGVLEYGYLGDLTFHSGVVNATAYENTSAIGGGHYNTACGSITLYGGTITATAKDAGPYGQEAIGHGAGGGNVSKTIADGLRVYKNWSTSPLLEEYAYRIQNGLSQKDVRVVRCTEHNYQSGRCSYCGAYEYHQISYNGNGNTSGTAPAGATYNVTIGIHTATGTIAGAGSLERTGYSFAGWNTAADGSGTAYAPDETITLTSSITLYAQWQLVTYTITYDLAGGYAPTLPNPETYTIESGDIILNNPTRVDTDGTTTTNYLFMGWTGTGLDGATKTVTIPAGSTGDRTYTATWDKNEIPFEGIEIDHYAENEVERYYIKMPSPEIGENQFIGYDENYNDMWQWVIISEAEENPKTVTIPEWFTSSFKVYDNGGKNEDYFYNTNDSHINTLILIAPEGKVFNVQGGRDDISVQNYYCLDRLTIYDGATTSDPTLVNIDEEQEEFDGMPFATSGNIIRFDLYTDNPDDMRFPGLNLTVTVTDVPTNIILANDDSQSAQTNASVITSNVGEYSNVTLDGRTLYRDGTWNTLCLPFDIDDISSSLLRGAAVKTLESLTYSDGTLTMNFSDDDDLTSIEAGKPYIVKWNLDISYNFIQSSDNPWGDPSNLVDGIKYSDSYWGSAFNDEAYPYCTFEASDGTIEVTGYTITTDDQNPLAWELYGKLNESDKWTLIDNRDATTTSSDALPKSAGEDKEYTAANPGIYRYFHFLVTKSEGDESDSWFYLRELTLQGVFTPDNIVNPTFNYVTISDETPVATTSGNVTFGGNYDTFASTIGRMFDGHNPDGNAMQAYLEAIDGDNVAKWYIDAERTIPATSIPFDAETGNVTLYATWGLPEYAITYNLDGGSVATPNPTNYTAETATFTLVNPTREGYTFLGWSGTDIEGTALTVTVAQGSTGNRTYTATWTLTLYGITYNGMEGATFESAAPTTYTIASGEIILNTPMRSGYTFGGWYTNAEQTGDAVTTITAGSTGDKEFWAKWTATEYYIVYNTNNGEMPADSPDSYTIESAAVTLPTPTRGGYTFAGWYDNAELTGDAVTTIATGSTGLKTFHAKWTLSSVDIAMNGAGIMTYSSEWPIDFEHMTKEDGTTLTAYIVSGYNPEAHSIVFTQVTDIPARTGLLLKGTAGATFLVPIQSTSMVYANLLVAVTSAETIVPQTDGTKTNYILANGKYGIDWYTLSQDGSIGANKAYLQLPSSASADVRALKWIFDDDATDIRTVDSSEQSDDSWYTLDGRKLSDAPAGRGIYILNGKKVIIK